MKSLVLKRSMVIYLLFILIGCQSLPVISIGGSTFKIYELLGLILLMQGIKYRKMIFLQCCFFYFIIAPCLSLLWGWLVLGYPTGFFDHFAGYPTLHSLKLNYYIFPFFCLIFMFANYCAIYSIVTNDWIYRNVYKVLRLFVYVGTVISLFSLLTLIGFDIRSILPAALYTSRGYIDARSSGFCLEPSSYIIYQTWVVIFTLAIRNQFKGKLYWYATLALNLVSLFLTMSSSLIVFAIILLLSPFLILKSSAKLKISIITFIVTIFIAGVSLLEYWGIYDDFMYIFQSKIEGFLTSPNYTTDSGSFRNYTSRIGIEIWKSSPLLGTGVSMSVYYMYIYEFAMGIDHFGEILAPTTYPQNLISQTLAETGLLGFISLVILLAYTIIVLWKKRKSDPLVSYLLMGTLCNTVYFSTNYTLYSFYLWVFIAFSVGYCFHINQSHKKLITNITNESNINYYSDI